MRYSKVIEVKEDCQKLIRFIERLEKVIAKTEMNYDSVDGSKHSGLVRHQSMILTRALADMRKSAYTKDS